MQKILILALLLSSTTIAAGEKDWPHDHGDGKHEWMLHSYQHPYSKLEHDHNNYTPRVVTGRMPSERRILKNRDGTFMITEPQPVTPPGTEFADRN